MKHFIAVLLLIRSVFSMEITLDGDLHQPLVIDGESLRAMAPTVLEKLPVVCKSGEEKVAPSRYKGVRLSLLLDQASFATESFKAYNTMAVIVTADDGYRVMFSYNELYNTPVGDGVIVAYEKDGQALASPVLLSGADRMTGPRHVRDLRRVTVRFLK